MKIDSKMLLLASYDYFAKLGIFYVKQGSEVAECVHRFEFFSTVEFFNKFKFINFLLNAQLVDILSSVVNCWKNCLLRR